jgi:cephalosporin hydroxylase
MNYELLIACRTLRKEGFRPLLRKLGQYCSQMRAARRFESAQPPRDATPEQVVDFGFQGCDLLLYPGQVRSEILRLAALVHERKPRVILEIGTANGGTLFVWCRVAPAEATILSLDLPGGIHGGGYPYWKTFLYRSFASATQRLHLLRGSSHDPQMRAQVQALLPAAGIDFLFIDGDHSYPGVKSDFELYAPLVRQGGVIALHDICVARPELDSHVDQFWNELKPGRQHLEFIEDPAQGWGGIGVLFV